VERHWNNIIDRCKDKNELREEMGRIGKDFYRPESWVAGKMYVYVNLPCVCLTVIMGRRSGQRGLLLPSQISDCETVGKCY
jgi:hypothetical protein